MHRISAFALALVASTASLAQTAYDPKVAYVQPSGKTPYLYLANADGTHAVRVAAGINGINGVDFAPGGNRIAFSDGQGLKLVSYTASNSGITVSSVVTLVLAQQTGQPDFSDDGSRILYYRIGTANDLSEPSGFRSVPAVGGTPTLLYQVTSLGRGRWLRSADMGNAFAFLKALPHGPNVPVDYEIWTVLLNANNQVLSVGPVVSTLSQDFKAIEDFDIARTRNALLIAANYPTTGRFVEFNLGTRQLIDKGGPGSRPSYSADDSRIIYREAVKGGAYITSLDPGTGLSTRLTAMGNVSAPDARP